MFGDFKQKYKKQMIKVAIGRISTSIMVVVFIAFTLIMVEYAIPNKNIKLIVSLGVTYFIVNILRAIATFYEDINQDKFQKEIEADYREKIFLKLQHAKQSEIDKIRVGEILENIINDTKEFSRYHTWGIDRSYFGGAMRLAGTLLVLICINVPIVLIALFIYMIGFLVTSFYNKKSLRYTKIKREINAQILNWSNEQVQGYSTIKSLEIENERLKQIKRLLKNYESSVANLEKNIRTYTCIYDLIISFVGVFNILLGAIGVLDGIVSYGTIIILARYISSPEVYAKWIIEGFQIRNIGKISYNRINDILQKEEENIEIGNDIEKIENIEFKNVNFSYNENKKVLNNISFKVKKGESIALVGKTGSGKTSLVNLICKFYELQNGEIKINGQDYRKYNIKKMREKIGYIMQNVIIFNGTIIENINYGNKEISKEKIIEVCKKLNLHEKIMTLKNEYETEITSDTDIFSAGEKQLLNFTRVMIQDPDIIILDEATASLSYKSEMMIRQAIEEITKGKISFIIAHRLSTVKKCNKILLMKNGEIVEEGDHERLMDKQGEYYRLVNI